MSSSTRPRVRVLIADDHPVYRQGVCRELEADDGLDVVSVCQDGKEALAAILELAPDVAVLDHRMPGLDGVQVALTASGSGSPTRMLILSAFTENATVYQALRDGAWGYLTKEAEPSEIVQAVKACHRGDPVLPPRLTAGLISEIRNRTEIRDPRLTQREMEILTMLASGMSTPDIARAVFLAPSTVKTHIQHVCDKLGVSGRAAVVAEAMRRGILD
ncbi:response regulator transcription factor [Streptomyces sp. WAC06614]|uniref:response regulator n=1 Tax=Streptomyces sp. WAC06614 TaxID=2487416 RepID=UPI000F7711A6|nr:response regulator transcription factor [Streptomyces sp. WAC06614]RSS81176.1 DNA-binding response regulator [Streptomyces sp. WAC06614]